MMIVVPTFAEVKQKDTQHDDWDVVETIEQDVKAILDEIGSVTLNRRLIVILRRTVQDPTNVCPVAAVARRMGITCAIGVCMMYAMSDGPLNRPAFHRQSSASHQEIFNQPGNLVTAMRDEA